MPSKRKTARKRQVQRKPEGWQPIETTPYPADGTRFFAAGRIRGRWEFMVLSSPPNHWPGIWRRDRRGYWSGRGLAEAGEMTHWMPLPAPPGLPDPKARG
jgi:hypothetical protein